MFFPCSGPAVPFSEDDRISTTSCVHRAANAVVRAMRIAESSVSADDDDGGEDK